MLPSSCSRVPYPKHASPCRQILVVDCSCRELCSFGAGGDYRSSSCLLRPQGRTSVSRFGYFGVQPPGSKQFQLLWAGLQPWGNVGAKGLPRTSQHDAVRSQYSATPRRNAICSSCHSPLCTSIHSRPSTSLHCLNRCLREIPRNATFMRRLRADLIVRFRGGNCSPQRLLEASCVSFV
jgi:hypothetical protein